MRSLYARSLAFGPGLVLLLAGATAYGQSQPPAKATPPVNVIIVIQTQPGLPGGAGTLALPGGVSITSMAVPPGTVRIGNVAVTPVKPAAATSPKPVTYKPGDRFGMLDVDKDGKLSRSEFKGPKNVFASVDADHNGFISKPEATRAYLAFVGRMAIEEKAQAFRAMDANHDGKLCTTEFKGPKPLFAAIDADHDGFITKAEAAKAFENHVHVAMMVAGLKSMDKNKDDKLTPQEFTGSIAQFLKLDVDKDGVITKGDVTKVITTAIAAKTKTPAPATAVKPTAKPASAVAKPAHVATTTTVAKPVVQAAAPGTRPGAFLRTVFAALDTNKDGKVTKDEFKQGVKNRFARIDADKNGSITPSELTKVYTEMAARRQPTTTTTASARTPERAVTATFQRIDANKDGKVSKKEFIKARLAQFARADTNKDGAVSRDELRSIIAAIRQRSVPPTATFTTPVNAAATPKVRTTPPPAKAPAARPVVLKTSQASTPTPATPAAGSRQTAMMTMLDTNKDGKVSKREYVQHAMDRFTKIDTNKDGILSQEELKAAGATIASRVRPTQPSSARPAASGRSPAARLARYDTDKDGKVSKDEYLRGITARFARLDVDKNGVITAADLARATQSRGSRPTAPPATTAKPVAATHAVAAPAHKPAVRTPGAKG